MLGTLTYTYDNNGNRLKQGGTWAGTGIPQPSGTVTVNANNQLLTFGNTTLTYDFNGNVTSATDSFGTAMYTWDARNRMTGITATGLAATFTYDPLGRRVNKTINGTVTRFLYDGLNPVQELSASAVTANLLTGLGLDEYLTRIDSAGTLGYLDDALGSTLALVDNTGTVQTSYTYEPFGNTIISGTASTNTFQYTGRENDGTGLSYYRARYYSSRLQRFFSEDPMGLAAGPNLYTYVANNPLRNIDPLGLDKKEPWWNIWRYLPDYNHAINIAREELQKHTGHNDLDDAMRHSEWSRRMYEEIGPFTAWTSGALNEANGLIRGEPLNEVMMDLHNNAEGRNAGQQQRPVDPSNLVTSPCTGNCSYNPYKPTK